VSTPSPSGPEEGSRTRRVKRIAITGTALTIPVLLTLVVLQLVLGVVAQAIAPVVAGIDILLGTDGVSLVTRQVLAVGTLLAIVLAVGVVAEYHTGSTRLAAGFNAVMARIPGLGSVYTGIRRMSEVLLEQDTQSFKEVKLVEYPKEGAFMLGFLTAQPPEAVLEAAGADAMQTLFIPLAPNPVMGGFLAHLPEDRVHDIDLTVEEGLQSIVTSGAAIDPRVDDVDVAGAGGAGHDFLDGDFLHRRQIAQRMPDRESLDRETLLRELEERDLLDRDVLDSDLLDGTPLSLEEGGRKDEE